MQAAMALPFPEPNSPQDTGDEPQDQANKVYPDSIFHPLHTRVHLRLLMNIHRPEEAEDRAPEDEEDTVPGEENRYGPV